MLYDTHAHPYMAKEKSEQDILARFFSTPDTRLNCIGVDIPTSKISVDLAKKYPHTYAVIGIHPCDIFDSSHDISGAMSELESLYICNKNEVVAIGEIGLDNYWAAALAEKHCMSEENVRELQEVFFKKQIQLAAKLDLPIVIHSREANENVLEVLQDEACKNFVFHCYSGDVGLAQRILEFSPNAKFGFGGTLTFKKNEQLREVVKSIPLKNIVIETDAPYLTPVPYRGKEENEPAFVQYVLDTVIDLRDESVHEISETIYNTSRNFFGIS